MVPFGVRRYGVLQAPRPARDDRRQKNPAGHAHGVLPSRRIDEDGAGRALDAGDDRVALSHVEELDPQSRDSPRDGERRESENSDADRQRQPLPRPRHEDEYQYCGDCGPRRRDVGRVDHECVHAPHRVDPRLDSLDDPTRARKEQMRRAFLEGQQERSENQRLEAEPSDGRRRHEVGREPGKRGLAEMEEQQRRGHQDRNCRCADRRTQSVDQPAATAVRGAEPSGTRSEDQPCRGDAGQLKRYLFDTRGARRDEQRRGDGEQAKRVMALERGSPHGDRHRHQSGA